MRAGSRSLTIFTKTLNARILDAHDQGSLRSRELSELFGWAPQSSLRSAVGRLCEIGALAHLGNRPGSATEITPAGRALLEVAGPLEAWLEISPDGPIQVDDPAAWGTIRTLVAAWDSVMIGALAEQPHTLLELNERIDGSNYPRLKRRLAELRSTGLATPADVPGKSSAYTASAWLRQASTPLLVAADWEHRFVPGATMSGSDLGAALLMALPTCDVRSRQSGGCALVILISSAADEKRRVTTVAAEIRKGKPVAMARANSASKETWALGTVDAWLDAAIGGRIGALRFGGEKPRLAQAVVEALQATFGFSRAASS